jgi:hypothetical protein
MTLLILIITQLLFTIGDLLASFHMRANGFTLENLIRPWFFVYFTIRFVATYGQLYVLAKVPVGWMSTTFGVASIILANLLGWLVLKQVLSPVSYAGVVLAVLAFLIMAVYGGHGVPSARQS